MTQTNKKPIILFDGVCNLCNGAVQFIIKRDEKSRFLFASLQSEFGQKTLRRLGLNPDSLHSIIMVEGDNFFERSDAALQIASGLRGWRFMKVFRIVPKVLRDAVYDVVSKHRYRLFGRKEQCMLPSPELQNRFIE